MKLYRKLDYDTEVYKKPEEDGDWCVDSQPPFYIRPIRLDAKGIKKFLIELEQDDPDAFWEGIKDYR